MKNKYPISAYNKYICLKMDYIMWGILIFLLRPFIVLVASVANRSDRMGLIDMLYKDKMMMSLGAFAGIPAAILIYAWTRREPKAPDYVKLIWRNGITLLTISVVLNILIASAPIVFGSIGKMLYADWIQLLITVAILITIYTHTYMRDCFADFPTKEST